MPPEEELNPEQMESTGQTEAVEQTEAATPEVDPAVAPDSPAVQPEGAMAEAAEEQAGDHPRIIKYDFMRPMNLSKRFKQTIESLGESFANQLAFDLSNMMRTNVEVSYDQIEEKLFREFLTTLENPACVGIFSAPPLKGQALLAVDGKLMFLMLDRLIGGEGKPIEELRDFTEIETRIFTLILNKILGDFKDASKRVINLSTSLSRVENNPNFINIMTGGDKALVIALNMTVGEHTGRISLCFSMSGFEPVIDKFDPKEETLTGKTEESSEDRKKIISAISGSAVEVVAELGHTKMTINNILNLQLGDTVLLDHPVDAPIPVKIGDSVIFIGEPGKSQNRAAIRIIEKSKTEVGREPY